MNPAEQGARDLAERTNTIVGSDVDQTEHLLLNEDDEFYDADLDGASCDLCGRDLECGQYGECDRCTGLAYCCDDLCYGAGWCMHR